jgi:hypothetical protein
MARTGVWGGIAVATTAAVLATAPFGLARNGADDAPGDDDRRGDRTERADVRTSVRCSLRSTAKLKLSAEDGGRVEAEFEVDQNRVGVRWRVAFARNGQVVQRRGAVTRAPSGSFEVRRVFAGGGVIRATAVNPRSRERCSVSARF